MSSAKIYKYLYHTYILVFPLKLLLNKEKFMNFIKICNFRF